MSSYENDRQQAIAISVGVNVTAELAKRSEDPFNAFAENVDWVVNSVLKLHTDHAVEAVERAMPGTVHVDVPAPAAAIAPVAVPQPLQAVPAPVAPVAAPVAIPGAVNVAQDTESLWIEFFSDVNAGVWDRKWWDNRHNKRNPKSPDFKHRDNSDKALWKVGKANPGWVTAALVQAGL